MCTQCKWKILLKIINNLGAHFNIRFYNQLIMPERILPMYMHAHVHVHAIVRYYQNNVHAQLYNVSYNLVC